MRGDLDVLVDDAELDAGVVLHFGLCGPEHIHEGGRLALDPGGVGAREHEQVLVVAAHPGGEVVELEQLGQAVRVLLAALEPVQVADQAVNQDLAAAGQVDEHGRDRGTQRGLFGGGADGLQVNRVERLGHLAELVPAAHGQRLGDLTGDGRRRHLRGQGRIAQPRHGLRQAVLGDGEGTLAQVPQRARHRPRHEPREEHTEQQGHQEQARLDENLTLHPVAELRPRPAAPGC